MRIATWNVNSIRTRFGRVVDWLVREDIDVLAMQETKCRPDQFPIAEFERAGYEIVAHGWNQWNGVAFASRHELTDVAYSFEGMPGFGKPVKGQEQPLDAEGHPLEARALGVTVGDLRLWSLYVPNGRSLEDPHYEYKLRWLNALRENTSRWLTDHPDVPLALMGDWNIAPERTDMGDPQFVEGRSTHVSVPERETFARFTEILTDPVRAILPDGYTFWDYQAGRFQKNEGMRIDFILTSEALSDAVTDASIHRDERKGDGPSDHVPVVIDVDPTLIGETFEDDFDRPMVF